MTRYWDDMADVEAGPVAVPVALDAVVGFDPPYGWAVTVPDGVLSWGQGKTPAESVAGALEAIGRAGMGGCRLAAVERPFGLARAGEAQVQQVIANAIMAGMAARTLRVALGGQDASLWMPQAGSWRRFLGVSGSGRAQAKASAIQAAVGLLAASAVPPAGPGVPSMKLEHASEAVCIAAAAWRRHRARSPWVSAWLRAVGA